jgi:putative acyl-CoA dehydrogenase
MVNNTRLDCTIGSASGMHFGVSQAVHHATHRRAFGARLIDQPLMRNVLADLTIEAEAATTVAMRLAGASDAAVRGDRAEESFRRLGLAVSKYWVCKRAPMHAAEALECLGGNGYVEESGMPRLYREAPLQSIWEGSGNVAALDTLRAMARQSESVEAYFAEVEKGAGVDARLDDAVAGLHKELSNLDDVEFRARRMVETMALVLQGSLLVQHSIPAVADAFCASRFGDWTGAFGTLPVGVDTKSIIERL